jgi:hypothetical protein
VDIRHDNQVVALGPMLPMSDRIRLFDFWKKSQMGGSRSRTTVPVVS